MSWIAPCPSCGAPVEFRSSASLLAVCDYCRSTLVRHGVDLENRGRMAELLADRSPLQRGSKGRWQGLHFALIGRLQLRWQQGVWSEWHLLFDDGTSAWLSDTAGELVLSREIAAPSGLPTFAELALAQEFVLAGRRYRVTNRLNAECIAGEGELPFVVGSGYLLPTADLRDETGRFASFDYSDDPSRARVFVGEVVPFAAFDWRHLRTAAAPTVKARAFACPSCGAALKVEQEDTIALGCPSCAALLDTANDTVRLLERARAQVQPLLPLGTRGSLRGEEVQIVGFMRRWMEADGERYYWHEYLLLGKDRRLLWLTESQGHWNLARVLSQAIAARPGKRLNFEGVDYKHFQSYDAHVDCVLGEFNWRVGFDERARIDDYVAPPYLLSRELCQAEQAQEVTWTQGEYLPGEDLAAAFGLPVQLPKPVGVFANQPNPHEAQSRQIGRLFRRFVALGIALHLLLWLFGPGETLLEQPLVFEAPHEEYLVSREFSLRGEDNRIEVGIDTAIRNSWIALEMTLMNKDSGQLWRVQREISQYGGVEDGERWTEGSGSDRVVFAALPAGTYQLAIDSEMEGEAATASGNWAGFGAAAPPVAGVRTLNARLIVERPGPRFSSLILLIVFLGLFPLIAYGRRGNFEVQRWAESDHPIVTS